MNDTLRTILKSLTGGKETISAVQRLASAAVGYISAFYAFSVLLRNLQITEVLEKWIIAHVWLVILIGIILSAVHNREKLRFSRKCHDADLQIELAVSDVFSIFNKATSFVIPTNTFFQTRMDDEYISPESVQGKFQNKYFKGHLTDLDKLIRESLDEQAIESVETHDTFGPVKQYPLGTVAKVDWKKKHYYFVAISDVNEYGKPINQNLTNVDIALSGLISTVDTIGHCDNLCTPLIGAGRAAITDATIETVFMKIVDRFVNTKKIVNRLTICIRPRDYIEEKANISRLKKYLDYRCEF